MLETPQTSWPFCYMGGFLCRGCKWNAQICGMKQAVSFFALFVFLGLGTLQAVAGDTPAQSKPAIAPQIMTVDEVRPGMKGVAYTVFQGTQPEAMNVEVLGVLRNLIGPKSDVVLVRLHGEKPEFTGVVAGRHGSTRQNCAK